MTTTASPPLMRPWARRRWTDWTSAETSESSTPGVARAASPSSSSSACRRDGSWPSMARPRCWPRPGAGWHDSATGSPTCRLTWAGLPCPSRDRSTPSCRRPPSTGSWTTRPSSMASPACSARVGSCPSSAGARATRPRSSEAAGDEGVETASSLPHGRCAGDPGSALGRRLHGRRTPGWSHRPSSSPRARSSSSTSSRPTCARPRACRRRSWQRVAGAIADRLGALAISYVRLNVTARRG